MLNISNFFQFFNSHKRLFTTTLPNRSPPGNPYSTFEILLFAANIFQIASNNPYFSINHAKIKRAALSTFATECFSIYGIYSDFTHIYASKMPYINSRSTLVLTIKRDARTREATRYRPLRATTI